MRPSLLYIERAFISFIYLTVNMERESIGKEVAAVAGFPKATYTRLAFRHRPFQYDLAMRLSSSSCLLSNVTGRTISMTRLSKVVRSLVML